MHTGIKMDRREAGCEAWTESIGSGYVKVAGSCECGNESSVSIKCGEFLE